jgi:hypothetical protein
MAYTNTIGILIAAKDEASAVIRKTVGETKAASAEVNGLGNAAGIAGGLFKGALVTGLIAAAGESMIMGVKFQQSMEMLHTNAGVAQDQIAGLSQKLLDMAPAVGQGPDKLAAAMYHIASAGEGNWNQAKQLDILKAAAEGAAIGQADLADTTYVLTSAMASGVGGAKNANDMMAILNATVGAGDMKLKDLNGALSTGILSTAATFGISIQSVGAALATLTDNGEHADEAATRLRMTFALMGSPSGAATKQLTALGLTAEDAKKATAGMNEVFKKSGLSTTLLADDLRKPNGITEAMKDLQKHLKAAGLSTSEADAMLSKAFGGGRTDAALLTMLNNIDRMDVGYKKIVDGSKNQGERWNAQQATVSQKIKDAWAATQVRLVEFGTLTLPFLGNAFGFLTLLISGHLKPLNDLASTIGKVLGPSFSALSDVVSKQVFPMLGRLWHEVIEPLIPVLGIILVGSIKLAVDILSILVRTMTPFVGFMLDNKDFLIPIIGAFGLLKTAMILTDAFNIITAGFTIMQVITIPSTMASFTAFKTLLMSPMVMPAIVIVAAAASIAYLWTKTQELFAAIDSANAAQQKATASGDATDLAMLKRSRDQSLTPEQRASANSYLRKMHVFGHALGTNFAPGGMTMVGENGPELVNLPTGSKVHTAQDTQHMMGGGKASIHIGSINMNTNVDMNLLLSQISWRLATA